jgi:GT2 family glycosyltransferase
MSAPYLSICIPTYRGAKRLERLLASMPAGGWAEASVEILVWDDGSPEADSMDLSDVLTRFEDGPGERLNVRLFRDDANRGAVHALRELTGVAVGEVVLQLDDDVVMPEGFFDTLQSLLRIPNIGVLSWRSCGLNPGQSSAPSVGMLQLATELAGYCMAYRREVHQKVGGIDPRFKMYCSDSDFTLRVAFAGHPCYRVWWPLVPHEEHGVYKDPANEELRQKREVAAQADSQAFLDKWGTSGPEMEKRALRQLVGETA